MYGTGSYPRSHPRTQSCAENEALFVFFLSQSTSTATCRWTAKKARWLDTNQRAKWLTPRCTAVSAGDRCGKLHSQEQQTRHARMFYFSLLFFFSSLTLLHHHRCNARVSCGLSMHDDARLQNLSYFCPTLIVIFESYKLCSSLLVQPPRR